MAAGHGGRRIGAGRPKRADLYAGQIRAAEDRIADTLPNRLAELERLAAGGWEQIDEEWVPAGTVTIGTGDNLALVYPHLPADELVLVKRRHSIAAPDRAAIIYLINRILGTPTVKVEADGDPDGTIAAAAEELYQARQELDAWRQQQMTALQSNMQNALLTPPMPATPTE